MIDLGLLILAGTILVGVIIFLIIVRKKEKKVENTEVEVEEDE